MGVVRTPAHSGHSRVNWLAATALSSLAALGLATSAVAQQTSEVRPISEAQFLSEVSGSSWLFDEGIGSTSYDYAALTASPLQGVPTYVSPASAPAPTDTASAAPMPAAVISSPITTARNQQLSPLAGADIDNSRDTAQLAASPYDDMIDGADTPALPAYMNPANGGAASAASNTPGALPALPALTTTTSDLPSLPPVQAVSAAPLPPSLGATTITPTPVSGEFDPYEYTGGQATEITQSVVTNARTVADANTPISDLPPIPTVNDVTVPNLLSGTGANARSLPAGSSGADGTVPILEDMLSSVGLADEDLVVQIGGGVTFRPDYIGSNEMEVAFMPVIDLEYRDRFFASTERGIGLNLLDSGTMDLAVFGDWRRGRKANGDISALADRSGSITLGGDGGISFGPLRLGVRADYGITGDMTGLVTDVEASFTQGVDVFLFELFGGVKLADGQYIENQFGYSASEATDFSVAAFSSDGGLVDFHGGIAAKYFLTPNFAIQGEVEAAQLLGDAADSYIVDTLGTSTQFEGGLSASYKF